MLLIAVYFAPAPSVSYGSSTTSPWARTAYDGSALELHERRPMAKTTIGIRGMGRTYPESRDWQSKVVLKSYRSRASEMLNCKVGASLSDEPFAATISHV